MACVFRFFLLSTSRGLVLFTVAFVITFSVITCSEPLPVDNSTYNYTSLDHGSEVWYTCGQGYHIAEGDRKLLCDSGQWLGNLPVCQGQCYILICFHLLVSIFLYKR